MIYKTYFNSNIVHRRESRDGEIRMKAEAGLASQQAPDPGFHILGGGVEQLFQRVFDPGCFQRTP